MVERVISQQILPDVCQRIVAGFRGKGSGLTKLSCAVNQVRFSMIRLGWLWNLHMKQMFPVLLALCTLGLPAQADGRSDTLRVLLGHVPTSFLGPVTDRWDIDFADFRAAAVAVSAPPEGTDALFLSDLAPFFRAGLAELSEFISSATVAEWPGLVGFAPSQISAAISVQKLPESAFLFQLDQIGRAHV